jgi:hypothetical protein
VRPTGWRGTDGHPDGASSIGEVVQRGVMLGRAYDRRALTCEYLMLASHGRTVRRALHFSSTVLKKTDIGRQSSASKQRDYNEGNDYGDLARICFRPFLHNEQCLQQISGCKGRYSAITDINRIKPIYQPDFSLQKISNINAINYTVIIAILGNNTFP